VPQRRLCASATKNGNLETIHGSDVIKNGQTDS
jgi:hypothetical protein